MGVSPDVRRNTVSFSAAFVKADAASCPYPSELRHKAFDATDPSRRSWFYPSVMLPEV